MQRFLKAQLAYFHLKRNVIHREPGDTNISLFSVKYFSVRCFDALFFSVLFCFALARLNKLSSYVISAVDFIERWELTPPRWTEWIFATICVKLNQNSPISDHMFSSSISEIVLNRDVVFFVEARCKTSSNRLSNQALFRLVINTRNSVWPNKSECCCW